MLHLLFNIALINHQKRFRAVQAETSEFFMRRFSFIRLRILSSASEVPVDYFKELGDHISLFDSWLLDMIDSNKLQAKALLQTLS